MDAVARRQREKYTPLAGLMQTTYKEISPPIYIAPKALVDLTPTFTTYYLGSLNAHGLADRMVGFRSVLS